jgi:hypothetical protein
MIYKPTPLPPVSRAPHDILNLFGPASQTIQTTLQKVLGKTQPVAGLDLEFDGDTPTILGLSDGSLTISVPWNDGLPFLLQLISRHSDIVWVGHAIVSADLFVLKAAGIDVPLANLQDTIIWHWLCNMNLCKGSVKNEDNDGASKGRGFMNLGCFLSLYTSLPSYKDCKGDECNGTYCPEHDIQGYNACFFYNTRIWMADNTWKYIQQVKSGEYVKSCGHDGNVCDKQVVRVVRTPYPEQEWLSVHTDGEHFGQPNENGVICTPDHQWFTDRGLIETRALQAGDRVWLPRTGDYDVIYGSVLGDGHIYNGDQFAVSHSNQEYLLAKARALDAVVMTPSIRTGKSFGVKPMFRTEKKTAKWWRAKFYCDKQKVWHPPSIKALAILYGDDGCIQRKFYTSVKTGLKKEQDACAKIALHKFMPQLEEIKGWFREHYGNCSIGNKAVLCLAPLASKKFWNDIAPYMHPSVQYKMPKLFHGLYNGWLDNTSCQLQRGEVVSVTKAMIPSSKHKYKLRYCLEVEDTHSFFTKAGLVKNCDSYGPVVALPNVITQAKFRSVTHLYDLHRELMYVTTEMTRFGLCADMPYVETLKKELAEEKERIETELPFSPTSPKQVMAFFKERGVALHDAQEETIRELIEVDDVDDEYLSLLLEYKELGNGPARWFGPKFVDGNGWVHPRVAIFTSSGRMMSRSPNFQNLSARRTNRHVCNCGHRDTEHVGGCVKCGCEKFKAVNVGKKVRRAVVAPPGWYIARYDLSNAENRVMLHLAGYDIPRDRDLHTWTAQLAQLDETMEFCKRLGGPRQAAKSVVHAGSYLEGVQLKTPSELRTPRIKSEINAGARIVYPNWRFEEKVVTFTGSNFAQRVYGDKTWENRAKALDIANKYFAPEAFGKMRDLQQKITTSLERQKAVVTPLGYYLSSYGQAEDRMKTACAVFGSQPVSHVTKLALINSWRKFVAGRPMRPVLQVHDELLFYVRDDVDPQVAAGWMREVGEFEMPKMPGLVIPIECSYSPNTPTQPSNWRDQTKLG